MTCRNSVSGQSKSGCRKLVYCILTLYQSSCYFDSQCFSCNIIGKKFLVCQTVFFFVIPFYHSTVFLHSFLSFSYLLYFIFIFFPSLVITSPSFLSVYLHIPASLFLPLQFSLISSSPLPLCRLPLGHHL